MGLFISIPTAKCHHSLVFRLTCQRPTYATTFYILTVTVDCIISNHGRTYWCAPSLTYSLATRELSRPCCHYKALSWVILDRFTPLFTDPLPCGSPLYCNSSPLLWSSCDDFSPVFFFSFGFFSTLSNIL